MLLWTIHAAWLETRSLLEMVANPGKPAAHLLPVSKISITQSCQLRLNQWFADFRIAGRSPLPAVE